MRYSRFLLPRLLLHILPELGQLVLKALPYNGSRLPRILLHCEGGLPARPLLAVLEGLERVGALVLGDDEHRPLHLQCQLPQFEQSDPGCGLQYEQLFDEAVGDGLPALLGNGPPPHLQGLPPPEAVEELERLDLHVEGLLLEPLGDVEEGVRLAPDVLAEALLADRVVLEAVLPLVLADHLEVHQLQLVDVLLATTHQVQELVDMVNAPQHQTHVLVQLRLRPLPLLLPLLPLPLLPLELHHLAPQVPGVAADGVGAVEGEKGGVGVVLGRGEELLGTLADVEVLARLGHLGGVRGLEPEEVGFGLFLIVCEGVFSEDVPLGTGDGVEQGRGSAGGAEVDPHLEQPPLEVGGLGGLLANGVGLTGRLPIHFKFVLLYPVELYPHRMNDPQQYIIHMGNQHNNYPQWPVISIEQWRDSEDRARRRTAHGRFRLLVNALTDQRIEEYGVVFQSGEEMEQYLQSFTWREREEHIVNTKYFQLTNEQSFCGSRIYAKVYIEHTPYRLSCINDIPLPENLYILCAALQGFHKLYSLIGYFRPSEDMVGIDREGRVKVWLNSDFSRNYLFGPHYYEGVAGEEEDSEERMVWEIISMVQQNTAYQNCRIPRLTPLLQSAPHKLSFPSAYQEIQGYARRFALPIPKYFVSLVNLFQERSNSEESRQSLTSQPFRVSESNIRDTQPNVVYYMDPSLQSSQEGISNKGQQARAEQECVQLPADTTGETFSNRVRNRDFQGSLPRIVFKYSTKGTITPVQQASVQGSRYAQTPHFALPLSRIAEHRLHESVEQTRRVTFSDNNEDYFLDEELAEDMARYLH